MGLRKSLATRIPTLSTVYDYIVFFHTVVVTVVNPSKEVNEFINAGCKFQDQGGIVIGDGTFIGHNTVLATLDHDIDPDRRHILYPAPIHIGRKVWIGAGVIITKGVTIGDNSIVAAGAVVTHDIPSNVIAAGVPARILREI